MFMGQDETSTAHPVEYIVNSTWMSRRETSSDHRITTFVSRPARSVCWGPVRGKPGTGCKYSSSSDKFNVLREMALSGISLCFCCVT